MSEPIIGSRLKNLVVGQQGAAQAFEDMPQTAHTQDFARHESHDAGRRVKPDSVSRQLLSLIAAFLVLGGSQAGHAEEARITAVQGSRIILAAGVASGLQMGMEVTLLRTWETIIHPRTGENLGAPKVEIGRGIIVRLGELESEVEVRGRLLLAIQPGDLARFSIDSGPAVASESATGDQRPAIAETAPTPQEQQVFRREVVGLTRSLTDVQRRIGSLENMMKRVERVEEGFRVQLRGINQDLVVMKRDINTLQEQMALYEAIPVGLGGERLGAMDDPGLTKEDVEALIVKVVGNWQTTTPRRENGFDLAPLPDEGDLFLEEPGRSPFYTQTWFFGLLGASLILGVAAFLYLKMTATQEEEDEEEEKDDEFEARAPAIELEAEDEDDIVVEETS